MFLFRFSGALSILLLWLVASGQQEQSNVVEIDHMLKFICLIGGRVNEDPVAYDPLATDVHLDLPMPSLLGI